MAGRRHPRLVLACGDPQLEPARLTRTSWTSAPPDPVALEADVAAAFSDSLEVLPNPDADVRFDDDASPWYTLCEVRSPDRRGLLHSLTAGMASAGAQRALGAPGDDRRATPWTASS